MVDRKRPAPPPSSLYHHLHHQPINNTQDLLTLLLSQAKWKNSSVYSFFIFLSHLLLLLMSFGLFCSPTPTPYNCCWPSTTSSGFRSHDALDETLKWWKIERKACASVMSVWNHLLQIKITLNVQFYAQTSASVLLHTVCCCQTPACVHFQIKDSSEPFYDRKL